MDAFEMLVRSCLIYNPVCVYVSVAIGHQRIISFPRLCVSELAVRVKTTNGPYAHGSPRYTWIETI